MDCFIGLGIYEVIKYYSPKVWYVHKNYPIIFFAATCFEILTSCMPAKYTLKHTAENVNNVRRLSTPLTLTDSA
jgi:hypothetical protein